MTWNRIFIATRSIPDGREECPNCEGSGVVGTRKYIDPRSLSPEWEDIRCSTCHGSGHVYAEPEASAPKELLTYSFIHPEGSHPSTPCPACDAEVIKAGGSAALGGELDKVRAGKACASCFAEFGSPREDRRGFSHEPGYPEWAETGHPYSLCQACYGKTPEGIADYEADRKADRAAQDYADSLYDYYEDEMRARAEEGRYF